MVNGKRSYVASLLAGLARTVEEGEAAVERCLSGAPARGDEKRVANYLAVANMMRDSAAKAAEGTVST